MKMRIPPLFNLPAAILAVFHDGSSYHRNSTRPRSDQRHSEPRKGGQTSLLEIQFKAGHQP
jgi:hypothetical protein